MKRLDLGNVESEYEEEGECFEIGQHIKIWVVLSLSLETLIILIILEGQIIFKSGIRT